MTKKLRVLAITHIFPNRSKLTSAPFNRQQFSSLAKHCHLETFATIPWHPLTPLLNRSQKDIPISDVIDELAIKHPRTLYLPKIGGMVNGPLYGLSLAPYLGTLRKKKFDVVLGSWAYPDGFGAWLMATLLNIPCAVKVHGSDLNVISEKRGSKAMIKHLFKRIEAVIAVSQPLATKAISMGAQPDRVHFIKNGIDQDLFKISDKSKARKKLGINTSTKVALYIGHLKKI